jgi:hypothetical protein
VEIKDLVVVVAQVLSVVMALHQLAALEALEIQYLYREYQLLTLEVVVAVLEILVPEVLQRAVEVQARLE